MHNLWDSVIPLLVIFFEETLMHKYKKIMEKDVNYSIVNNSEELDANPNTHCLTPFRLL